MAGAGRERCGRARGLADHGALGDVGAGLAGAVGRRRLRHLDGSIVMPTVTHGAVAHARRAVDAGPVHAGPVARAEILDLEPAGDRPDGEVAARELGVVDHDVDVLPPDDQLLGHLDAAPFELARGDDEVGHGAP